MVSSLVRVEASESGQLLPSNGLEAYRLGTAVQQQLDEKKHHLGQISCLPHSFETVKNVVLKNLFVTLCGNVFIFRKKQSPIFRDKPHYTITNRELCGAFYICWGRSEPYFTQSFLLQFSDCENPHLSENQFHVDIRTYFRARYDDIEQSQSS